MQKRVAQHFVDLRGPSWRVLDAARTVDEVRADVEAVVLAAAAETCGDDEAAPDGRGGVFVHCVRRPRRRLLR
jgi:hypothetical protein